MKRIGLIMIIALVVGVFSACSLEQADTDEELVKVGFVVSDLENPFFMEMYESALYKGEVYHVEVMTSDSGNDSEAEYNHVKKMVDEGIKLLLINPTDSLLSRQSVTYANEAGVPVITLDRKVLNVEVVCHIASDNFSGGKMAGEYVDKVLNGTGEVFVFEGIAGTDANIDRINGFSEVLNKTDVDIIWQKSAEFDRVLAYNEMVQLIEAGVSPDAVFAANDEMALGVLDAMLEAGEDIIVVGFDGTDEAVNAVMNGYLSATVAQQPDLMAATGVEVAVKTLEGEVVEDTILIPLKLISISK